MQWIYPPTHLEARQSHWRTYVVFGHTLWGSMRIVSSGARGALTPTKVDHRIQKWCDRVFGVSRTALAATGLEHHDGSPCILLSNHTSLLDIPAVCATWPGRVRFVAKQELRSIPGFGAAMEAAGIIFVDRSNRAKAIAQLAEAENRVRDGLSLWISAEGGRSRDGRLHTFKKGGFHTALKLQVPLVPVWIHGTLNVLPPDQLASVTDQTVTVHYGHPIPTTGRTVQDLPSLMGAARTAMLELAHQAGAPPTIDACAP